MASWPRPLTNTSEADGVGLAPGASRLDYVAIGAVGPRAFSEAYLHGHQPARLSSRGAKFGQGCERTEKLAIPVVCPVRMQPAGRWLWPLGAALGTAGAIALDIVLIANGAAPAVLGLFLTFAIPAVAGFALGLGNRRSNATGLLLMALVTAGVLYSVMVAVSVVGIAMSSNVSCAEPSARWNCDNDTGDAVGIVVGIPLAISYGVAVWLASLAGRALATKAVTLLNSA